MLRCMGGAEKGAVLVAGGAENVMLPRLPIELPPPARASTTAGVNARVKARAAANKDLVRRIGFRFLRSDIHMVISHAHA